MASKEDKPAYLQNPNRSAAAKKQQERTVTAARQATTKGKGTTRQTMTDRLQKDQDLDQYRINFSVRVRQETRLYYHIRIPA